MKLVLKPFLLLFIFLFLNCKEEKPLEYKFEKNDAFLECETPNKQLIEEALYTFENDIRLYYDWNNRNPYVSYTNLVYKAMGNAINFQKITSPHTVAVFEKLENIDKLWVNEKLNYDHELIKCLIKNMKNEDIKTITKSLISANSLKPKYYGTTLIENYIHVVEDKHLATFVALEIFYSGFFNEDTERIKTKVLNKLNVYEFPKQKSN